MIEIPKQLQKEEFRFILLGKKSKKPIESKWTSNTSVQYKFNDPKLVAHIADEGNYGVLCGNSLIVLDIDDVGSISEIEKLIPETFTIRTGSGTGKKHYYFICNQNLFTRGHINLEKNKHHIGEMRCNKVQVVGPNSIHEITGLSYIIEKDIEIKTLSETEFKAIVSLYSGKEIESPTVVWDNYNVEFQNEICKKLPIESIINMNMLRTGNNEEFYGEHPIHGSTTGMNFWINKTKNLWHCFRCNCGGDSLSLFAMKQGIINCGEKLKGEKFRKTLEILRIQYGIEIESSYEKVEQEQLEHANINSAEFETQVLRFIAKKDIDKATELLARGIMKTEYIYTIRHDEKPEIWIYKDGIYVPQGESFIKEICRQVLKNSYNVYLVNKVVDKIQADSFIEQEKFFINENIDFIAVENGILNLKTGELSPFNPDSKFFNKIPVKFDKEANCPNIEKFMKGVLDSEENIKVVQELFGYCLYRSYKIEKAIMFLGDGRNGKSKTVELLRRFLGIENCCSISLQSLEDTGTNFSVSELHNKLANISADISKEALKNTGNFRSLTGRDMMSAARKFLSHVKFENYAKFVFCANEMPEPKDATFAFFARWVVLDFKYTFLPEKEIKQLSLEKQKFCKIADTEIIDKITTPEELSGLLNWAVIGLNRILAQRDFSSSKSMQEIETTWTRKSNSALAFVKECIIQKWDSKISKRDLRDTYELYCKNLGLHKKNDAEIKHLLVNLHGASEGYHVMKSGGSQEYTWVGIDFNFAKVKEAKITIF